MLELVPVESIGVEPIGVETLKVPPLRSKKRTMHSEAPFFLSSL